MISNSVMPSEDFAQNCLEDHFGNFLYNLDVQEHIKSMRFVTPKEMYIVTSEKEIHIRERTPEKMYTRAIFEVLHNI